MEIKIKREKKYSVTVNEEELKSLVNFLASQYSPIEMIIKCNDGSTLTTHDLEDIINFENSKFRKIEVMEISFGKAYSQGGTVEFNSRYATLQTCEFTVKDNDDAKALRVSNEIEARFEECKTWYWFLTKFPPSLIIPFIYCLIWIPSLWINLFRNTLTSHPDISIIDLFNIIGVLLPILLLYIVSIVYLDKAWAWLFPRVWFDIGKQKAQLKKREKIRIFVFGGVIGTMILGIIVNLISHWITK